MAGNWKMYKTASETTSCFDKFNPLVAQSQHCEIVICPAFVNLPAAIQAAQGTRIGIGGQNLFWAKEGAYTGEISGPMLKALGAQWVIIGHSENR
jgi:triosephosphate isomerase